MPKCIYYIPEWEALITLCNKLYSLEECSCGGMLHILLDDGNIDDDDIEFCLDECIKHPEKPESNLGILICYEYLKMDTAGRKMFEHYRSNRVLNCRKDDCSTCYFNKELIRIAKEEDVWND